MKRMRTRILGGASLAGFAVAVTLALAPAAHADPQMADGSVRFVKDSIQSGVYVSLSTRSGGEVITDASTFAHSRHTGGVNFVFGDGVRAVPRLVDGCEHMVGCSDTERR